MLSIFDSLRAVTMASITLRMLLSVLCGGLIGIEREYKRRPAGFRTHILICLGAAMVSLTSQFLFLNMHYYLDVSRMSASVTAGIGFIGAGSIIVTRQQRVKGLTTAAGLWASAFYEGALLATVLVLLAEAFLSKLEYWMMDHAPEINLYMEYETRTAMDAVLQLLRAHRVTIQDMEITRPSGSEDHRACAIFSLRFNRGVSVDELLTQISQLSGILSVQEL